MSIGTGVCPSGQRPSGSAQMLFCRARSSSMCFLYVSRKRLTLANWNGNSSTALLGMSARSLPCAMHIPLVSARLLRILVHPSYLHQLLLYVFHIAPLSRLWTLHKLQSTTRDLMRPRTLLCSKRIAQGRHGVSQLLPLLRKLGGTRRALLLKRSLLLRKLCLALLEKGLACVGLLLHLRYVRLL